MRLVQSHTTLLYLGPELAEPTVRIEYLGSEVTVPTGPTQQLYMTSSRTRHTTPTIRNANDINLFSNGARD